MESFQISIQLIEIQHSVVCHEASTLSFSLLEVPYSL